MSKEQTEGLNAYALRMVMHDCRFVRVVIVVAMTLLLVMALGGMVMAVAVAVRGGHFDILAHRIALGVGLLFVRSWRATGKEQGGGQ